MFRNFTMKKLKLFFILTSLIFCAYSNAYGQRWDTSLKEYAKSAPPSIEKSPLKLARYLTENEPSKQQQVLNIYTWMIYNIRYEVKELSKIERRHYTPKQTLQRKKGICSQYSELFQVLCAFAGISAKEITGYVKGPAYTSGDLFFESDHSWNAVYLDSAWYLLDATWGSGHVVPKKRKFKALLARCTGKVHIQNSYKFQAKPTLTYFLTPPEKFLLDHLPADPSWQLVTYPISIKSFEQNEYAGYTGKADPWVPKEVKASTYEKILATYRTMSPQRFQGKTAKKAQKFNPRNTKLLASYYFTIAPSYFVNIHDPESQIQTNNTSIKHYQKAVKYAKAHISSSRQTTQKNNKSLQTRVSQELAKPTQNLTQSAQGILRKIGRKRQVSKKRNTNLETEQARLYEARKNIKISSIKQRNFPSKTDPKLLKQHQDLIDESIKFIEHQLDTLRAIPQAHTHFQKRRSALYEKIIHQNGLLNDLLDKGIKAMSGYANINKLSLLMQKTDSLRELQKGLHDSLNELEKSISDKLKRSRKATQAINKKGRVLENLLSKHCQLSQGKACKEEQLEQTYINRGLALDIQIELIDSLFFMNRQLDNFNASLYKTLLTQTKKLKQIRKYISSYHEACIREKRLKEVRNLRYAENILKESKKEIHTLKIWNKELHRQISSRNSLR